MTKAEARYEGTKIALALLKSARLHLRDCEADQAANYVVRAIKSAEGAVRHAQRLIDDELRQRQVLHHIDGNPRNNDPANLVLVALDRRSC